MEAEKYERSAQATVWNFIYGYTETLVLKCAVQLDIPTIIHNHGKPMSISQLSAHLPNQPIDQDRLYRIMRYLVHLKFFTKWLIEGETRFGLAPPAKFLIKGWDKSMVPIVLAMTDKNYMASWHYVKEGLVGDKVALEKALGMGIWDYMADHPEMSQRFNEAMASDTRLVTSALVSEECKGVFEGIASLVDVGGGTGTALRSIAKAFPNVKCTLYDLPHVISNSPRYPEISCVEGDMFKYIPRADAVLMKCILHDWGDKECIEILKRCKEAVPRDGGKVIIVDIVIDTQSTHPYTKMRLTSDLDMMLNTGGKERSEEEWKNLILAAGYSGYNITQISAVPSVIEAFPY